MATTAILLIVGAVIAILSASAQIGTTAALHGQAAITYGRKILSETIIGYIDEDIQNNNDAMFAIIAIVGIFFIIYISDK